LLIDPREYLNYGEYVCTILIYITLTSVGQLLTISNIYVLQYDDHAPILKFKLCNFLIRI